MLILLLGALATSQPVLAEASPPAAHSAAAQPFRERAARCDQRAAWTAGPAAGRPRKLGELTPGKPMLAVNLQVDGCPVNLLPARDAHGHLWEWAPVGAFEQTPVARAAPPQPRGQPGGRP